MLVDQLRLAIAAQQHAEVVEPGDHALQLDAVDQEDRHRNLGLADVVQKGVLQVLLVAAIVFCLVFLSLHCRVVVTVRSSPVFTALGRTEV
jgi:hypothetical protein